MKSMSLASFVVLFSVAFSYGQKKKSYSLFYENSILRSYAYSSSFENAIKNYKSLPGYLFQYELPYNKVVEEYDKGTFKRRDKNEEIIYGNPIYYRNTTLGLHSQFYEKKRITAGHSAGFTFSMADVKIGKLASWESKNVLGFDQSRGYYYYLKSKNVYAYKNIRRIAIFYENNVDLKFLKWMKLTLGLRHQLHLKYKDDLLIRENHIADTFDQEYESNSWIEGYRKIDLYDKEKPYDQGFQNYERKMGVQYDATLYLRPEFMIGKKKKTSFYFNIGFNITQQYGKDYTPDPGGSFYGVGLARQL